MHEPFIDISPMQTVEYFVTKSLILPLSFYTRYCPQLLMRRQLNDLVYSTLFYLHLTRRLGVWRRKREYEGNMWRETIGKCDV